MEGTQLAGSLSAMDSRSAAAGGRPLRSIVWRRFHKNMLSTAGLVLLSLLLASSLSAPWLSPYDPAKTDLSAEVRLQAPTDTHWFGTDHLGRDGSAV